MSIKKGFKGENYAQNPVKSVNLTNDYRTLKSVFEYNIDLLKHVCVVSKIENTGIVKFLKFLQPNARK